MMLREPSVRVRDTAAAELEERQRDWAYSKPVVAFDLAWNLAIIAIGATVLGMSEKEKPCMPLRVWIVGYLLLGLFHSLGVVLEFRRRMMMMRRRITLLESSSVLDHSSALHWSFSSESDDDDDDDDASEQFLDDNENRYTSFKFNLLFIFLKVI